MANAKAEFSAGTVARAEPVRYHRRWSEAVPVEKLAHQSQGRLRVSSPLHQDAQGLSFLVHRPPEPEPFTCDPGPCGG
jgi:hypothetical protein